MNITIKMLLKTTYHLALPHHKYWRLLSLVQLPPQALFLVRI